MHQLRWLLGFLGDADPALRCRAGAHLADLLMDIDEDDAALTAAEIAVEALPQDPPRWERARALATHARALMSMQDLQPARSRAEQAQAAAKAAKAPRVEADALPGERWLPMAAATNGGLRVPVDRTLENLVHRHSRFLTRLGPDGFSAPPPLSAYGKIEYRRSTDWPSRSVAAFSLLKLDASGLRTFDTASKALTVAGMMRGVTKAVAKRATWPESKIRLFILGHGESNHAGNHVAVGARRFAYLPLPSIEARNGDRARVVGSVRRVMLTAFADGCEEVHLNACF